MAGVVTVSNGGYVMVSVNGDRGWFDFGAWMRSPRVRQMTREAQACYFDLLCHGWLRGGIPATASKLRALLGLSSSRFRRIWEQIGPLWQEKAPGLLVNETQEQERAKLLASREAGAERQRRKRDQVETVLPPVTRTEGVT